MDEIRYKIILKPFLSQPEKTVQQTAEGYVVIMTCRVLFGNGNEKVAWVWYHQAKDERAYTVGISDRIVVDDENANQTSLEVFRATLSDVGLYTCEMNSYSGMYLT